MASTTFLDRAMGLLIPFAPFPNNAEKLTDLHDFRYHNFTRHLPEIIQSAKVISRFASIALGALLSYELGYRVGLTAIQSPNWRSLLKPFHSRSLTEALADISFLRPIRSTLEATSLPGILEADFAPFIVVSLALFSAVNQSWKHAAITVGVGFVLGLATTSPGVD